MASAEPAPDTTPEATPAAVPDEPTVEASSTAVTSENRTAASSSESEPRPDVVAGAGGEPQERMGVSALAVTLPDVSEGEAEVSGELWASNRRQAEPELPMVEVHPENPDAAPVVSGVIQGFVAHQNPEARASSALAVEFGAPGEPSIQIEPTYEQDSKKALDDEGPADSKEPVPKDPSPETPVQATAATESETPELGTGPFAGDTDRVNVPPDFEEPKADPKVPEAEVLPTAEALPTAEVDDVTEGDSLPVYAVGQADGPLVEVPEPDEDGPAPTKRATVMDEPIQPETRTDDEGQAVVHPSPFPPAQDPRVKDAGPISDAGAYAAPDHEPKAPVSLRPFQPAAFVSTAGSEDVGSEAEAQVIKPKLAGVPPLILPSNKNDAAAAGATGETTLPSEPAPPDEPPETAPSFASGVIGGAIVSSPALQQQQEVGEPLTASGSIIIDPELLAAEQAAAEQAAAEQAAAEKAAAAQAAAAQAAAEQAAIEQAAAEHAAAEQAAAEQAAAEQAAAEKAAAEQAVAAQAAAEQAATEQAAAEQAAAEKAAAEAAASKAAETERDAISSAAAEIAAAQIVEAERVAAEKAATEKVTAKAAERAAAEKAATDSAEKPSAGDDRADALGKAMAATVRYELSEQLDAPIARKKPEPPTSQPVASAAKRNKPPKPLKKADAFSDMEIAFFEQDLQKVEEVDTFDDLVSDLPEPETPWGRLFGKPKGKPKKRPEPNRRAAASDKPKKTPRPPHKRK